MEELDAEHAWSREVVKQALHRLEECKGELKGGGVIKLAPMAYGLGSHARGSARRRGCRSCRDLILIAIKK